ncbi:hypothetical protein WA026_010185, partial [Henosepilachna vigintioctopunctata]
TATTSTRKPDLHGIFGRLTQFSCVKDPNGVTVSLMPKIRQRTLLGLRLSHRSDPFERGHERQRQNQQGEDTLLLPKLLRLLRSGQKENLTFNNKQNG